MRMGAALALLAGLSLVACGGGQPDIELPEPEADLGAVTNGEIRTLEVPVQNLGRSDLIIEAVTTSCGCTSAEVTPATIPGGSSGTLAVRFDSGAHGPEEVGPVLRQVFIATNDPDEPEVEFRFTAMVTAATP